MKIINGMVLFWKCSYSQWNNSGFESDGTYFKTAEHYMMYKKAELFKDYSSMGKILLASHPRHAQTFGREVKGFDKEVWEANCIDIVSQGNYLKFKQNPELLEKMFLHRELELVEASPYDKIWGIGLDENNPKAYSKETWQGTNYLGISIMNARERLLEEFKDHKLLKFEGTSKQNI